RGIRRRQGKKQGTGKFKQQQTQRDRSLAAAAAPTQATPAQNRDIFPPGERVGACGTVGGRKQQVSGTLLLFNERGNAFDHHPQKAADNAAKRAAEQAKGGHLAALKQRQRVHATFAQESLIWA